jgi:hypothetical protein
MKKTSLILLAGALAVAGSTFAVECPKWEEVKNAPLTSGGLSTTNQWVSRSDKFNVNGHNWYLMITRYKSTELDTLQKALAMGSQNITPNRSPAEESHKTMGPWGDVTSCYYFVDAQSVYGTYAHVQDKILSQPPK